MPELAPDHAIENMRKNLDIEIREMIAALTGRLATLRRSDKVEVEEEDDDRGLRIITLAGNNLGATMRGHVGGEKEKEKDGAGSNDLHHHPSRGLEENDALSTFVNSNFQAINNSIMLGGSYTTNDPGVHMDISDHYPPDKQPSSSSSSAGVNYSGVPDSGRARKGKGKLFESSKSDQLTEVSE